MAATASNTNLPGRAWLLSWPACGRTDVMIGSCHCYGVSDLLRVPSLSSCGWVIGSVDALWVLLTLRFARCSSSLGPGLEVLLWTHRLTAASLDCCNRWHGHWTIHSQQYHLTLDHIIAYTIWLIHTNKN